MRTAPSHWPLSILSIIAAGFSMLLPLALVRLITPEEVGVFKIFYLYLLLVHGFTLVGGFMNGLSYWVGQAEPRRTAALHASSVVTLFLALLSFAGALLLHGGIVSGFGWSVREASIFALLLMVANPACFFDEVAIASGRIWSGALFSSAFEIMRVASVLGVAYWTRDLDSLLGAFLLITALRAVCGYALALKMGFAGFNFNFGDLRAVCRYAMPVSLASISVILVGNADQVLISAALPPEEFALYALGCLAVPPLFILEQSVTRVLIPQLAGCFARNESAEGARLFRAAVSSLSFLIVPAVAGMAIFSEPIVDILFTSRFGEAANYLRVFAFSYLALLIPYDAVARARGHASWILKSYSFFSVLSIALSFLGMALWGAMGALIAMLLTRFSMRGFSIFYMNRRQGWRVGEYLPVPSLVCEALLAATLGACCTVGRPLFDDDRLWFFVCGALFAALYLPGVRLIRSLLASPRSSGESFALECAAE